jgi:hypothetical protein
LWKGRGTSPWASMPTRCARHRMQSQALGWVGDRIPALDQCIGRLHIDHLDSIRSATARPNFGLPEWCNLVRRRQSCCFLLSGGCSDNAKRPRRRTRAARPRTSPRSSRCRQSGQRSVGAAGTCRYAAHGTLSRASSRRRRASTRSAFQALRIFPDAPGRMA